MKITLKLKFILFITLLVTVIMATVTYFFTISELDARRGAMESQIKRIAQNIATMQLLDQQDWNVYQNYITQLMAFNKDIIYIAILDDRQMLRAHTLNKELVEMDQEFTSRRQEAKIVELLDSGGIAEENQADIRTVLVDIQVGERILGSVHVGFSIIDINKELQNGIMLNIGLGLSFILIFSGISIFISQKLTMPLEHLSNAMQAVNEGNLMHEIKPKTRDEIATLTHSFNEMVEGMRERRIIENLGIELSATFRLEQLAPLVRDRLNNAIGAGGTRLYIRDFNTPGIFNEITVPSEQISNFPPLKINSKTAGIICGLKKGFMIQAADEAIRLALNHQTHSDDGLVIPMTIKDELFGLLYFALPQGKIKFSKKQQLFAATLAGQAALALENAILYKGLREQERLKRELEIAKEVQQKLLPTEMPEIPDFQISSVCQPAFEVGGDYYDFFPLNDSKLGVVIADVSGKGTSASFYMAEIKGMMLSLVSNHDSPAELLHELNDMLYDNLDKQSFVTMIYGILDPSKKTFTFARAGHNPLLKINRNSSYSFLNPEGIGLALDDGEIFAENLREAIVTFNQGDTILLYTDGITEAMVDSGEEYGEKRLLNSALSSHADFATLQSNILLDLDQFMAKKVPHDDITVVLIRYNDDKIKN